MFVIKEKGKYNKELIIGQVDGKNVVLSEKAYYNYKKMPEKQQKIFRDALLSIIQQAVREKRI